MKVIMPVWIINEDLRVLTENAVSSLGNELIIIDNASTQGGGYLRSVAHTYILNRENLGYAKAVNQGLSLCKDGELVAIANNDIRVSDGWEKVAQEVFKENDRVCSLHFRMLDYNEPFRVGFDTWIGGKERWCTSSFFVVRNLQRYDENFLNSYDDWDFWKRLRDKGFKQAYTNKVAYQHLDSSTQELVPDRAENNKRNQEYFKQKHGGYAEELFAKEFPEQIKLDWRPFP